MRRVMLGGFVALALLAGACSDGDEKESDGEDNEESSGGSGSRDEYVEAFMVGLTQLGVTDDESRCMAEAMVDTVGTEGLDSVTSPQELEESGAFDPTALNIEQADAETLYDDMAECADLFQVLFAAGGDPTQTDCLRQNIDDATLKAVVVSSFTGSTDGMAEAQTAMTDAYNACTATDTLPTTDTTLPATDTTLPSG